jgi:hypothetical protein
MNIEEKYKLLVEKITKRAEQNIRREEEDFDLYSYCGGNYDDAYSIGVRDGEIQFARDLLSFRLINL